MRKSKKSLMAKSILCSVMAAGMAILITPPYKAFAEEIKAPIGEGEYKTTNNDDLIINGEGENKQITALVGIVGNNKTITINGYNTVTLQKYDKGAQQALYSANGAKINISNVGTVNIGTPEKSLLLDAQGRNVGIHAMYGDVSINSNDNVSVNTQMPTGTNAIISQASKTYSSNVNITAKNDVKIKSDGGAIGATILADDTEQTANVIIEAKNVSVESIEGAGISGYAQNWQDRKELNGNTNIKIVAENNVDIKAATQGVLNTRDSNKQGKSAMIIQSKSGDVNISGDQMAVYAKGTQSSIDLNAANKLTIKPVTSSKYFTTYIDDATVNLNAEDIAINGAGAAIIYGKKGTLNINQTGADGSVDIKGYIQSGLHTDEKDLDGGTVNLSADGDTSNFSGNYAVYNKGNINFNKGNWSINGFIGDASANLKVAGPAALNVNTAVTVGSFTAEEGSITSFDVSKGATINTSSQDNIVISPKAEARVFNAQRGKTYSLITANGGKVDSSKDFANVKSGDNLFLTPTLNEDGSVTFKADATAVANALPDTVIANIVGNDKLSADSAAAGFFDKAGALAAGGNTESATNSLNSLANIGELGGTSHGTYTASNIMTDLVNEHLSLATHGKQDRDLWAHYIHSRENVDGMSLGGLDADYDANYNGVIVGGEFYNKGKVSAGAAFSYIDGSIKGNTLTARTENDADYYGLSLYGKINNGDSAVFGDISYLHGKNDITQTNMGEKITADPKSDAFSIGVRAEKSFEAGAGQLVPYIGARYMKLGVGDYKDSFGINYDADEQDLFMVPVGVSYSTEIKHDDWTVSPYAKAGYVWTFGDRETDQTVSLAGAADTFGFETADSGSFVGQLGINAENDAMSYGLGYSYQKGDSVQANKWMANVLFKF